jgi:hypothetical protein
MIKMMTIVNVYDFHLFEEIGCIRCAALRAMETGLVHVDAEIRDEEGWHLVAFSPYHTADMDYCRTGKYFAERVWALKPNKRLVWQSCLRRLSQDKNHKPFNDILTMEYLWSDLSVVQEVLADTVALLPTVIVEKLAWMTGCRRAWLAAVTCFH